ncbi:Nif11-like leader peptide family natural product precursor [Cyanothece sp. BG0011]|uniref:Nif11-like leader peptide family natural product precursor n=1 Tax=Cyanothece sp. BG0011 TaxID=2082950 RepID=UPI000D1E9963|nr:Nif11-like leader peptide family natural product precursor [Cyanothece sp. BG0011]
MSLSNVQRFYQRLSEDEAFRAGLQTVNNKEECSHFVKKAGYDFTQEEFESYTAELLESSEKESKLQDTLEELNEQELAAVLGGLTRSSVAIYGLPPKLF